MSNVTVTTISATNWADPNINRVGVLPIYRDSNHNYWLGFGINTNVAAITTIGGSWENSVDHDLFDTVRREFEEETKMLFPEPKIDWYVIRSPLSMLVLIPFATKFTVAPNISSELYTTFWITPNQLLQMSKHESSGKGKPFSFAGAFRDMVPVIVDFVNSGRAFDEQPLLSPSTFSKEPKINILKPDWAKNKKTVNKNRPAKIPPVIKAEEGDFQKLVEDAKTPGNFSRGLFAVMDVGFKLYIMRGYDNTIYHITIPEFSETGTIFEKLGYRIYVAPDEREIIRNALFLEENRVLSVFGRIGNKYKDVMSNFDLEYKSAKNYKERLNILVEYEKKVYDIVSANKTTFNKTRADRLIELDSVNRILSTGSKLIDDLSFYDLNNLKYLISVGILIHTSDDRIELP